MHRIRMLDPGWRMAICAVFKLQIVSEIPGHSHYSIAWLNWGTQEIYKLGPRGSDRIYWSSHNEC